MQLIKKRLELEQKHFPQGVTTDMVKLLDDVEEALRQAYQAGYKAAESLSGGEEWSNNACLGYAIYGARKLEYTEEQTKKLVRAMYGEFDRKSLQQAKDEYNYSPY